MIQEKYAMTSQSERSYCEKYAATQFTGQGAMIELGCWLGSLTNSLANGLKKNELIRKKEGSILVFDYYQWDVIMEDWVLGTPYANRIEVGGNFKILFDETTESNAKYIQATQCDLTNYKWDRGSIEFMIIDSMKTYPLCQNIISSFYPSLIQDDGLIFHQDYIHFFHSWIHLSLYWLRDYFETVEYIRHSNTVILKNTKSIPQDLLKLPQSMNDYEIDFIDQAFQWNLDQAPDFAKPFIAAANTMCYVHRHEQEAAREHWLIFAKKGFTDTQPFKEMQGFCERFQLCNFSDL